MMQRLDWAWAFITYTTKKRMMRSLLVLTLGALVSGCGIDRGGAPDGDVPPIVVSTVTDTLIAGPISATMNGELDIAGTRIEIGNTLIAVDDAPAALDQLQAGQYAVVRANTATGANPRATSVNIFAQVTGMPSDYDAVTNALTILGQQVVVSAQTMLDPALANIAPADLVATGPLSVAGVDDGLGTIQATYIAPANGAATRLTGFASMVDDINMSFEIGGQRISYASALLINLPTTAPEDNTRVSVTGSLQGVDFQVDTLIEAPLLPANLSVGATVRLTATITEVLTGSTFSAGFVSANLSTNAVFIDGVAADIVPGTIVTLGGQWTNAQRINVTSVRFASP
ncbi:MAG: hypothetical protein AB8G17_00450 [Gammaproteobacteria bacterium]